MAAYGGSALLSLTPPKGFEPLFIDDYYSLIEWLRNVPVRSAAGTVYFHTGVGLLDSVNQRTLLAQEDSSIVIRNNNQEKIKLEFHQQLIGGKSNQTLQIENIVMEDAPTLIQNGFYDILAILENGIGEISKNSTVKINGLLTDVTSVLIIPYGTTLILPNNFIFDGKSIILKGSIVGAQKMILKNSAILNIYPNSSWISLKTYNKKDFNNNNCRNVFNISSVFLEDQSSIQIRSNDSYEKEISIFYFGTLNIRSKRILKFICLLFYSFIYLFVDFLIIYQFIHSLLFLFYSFNLFFFVTFWIISFVSCILFSKRYFHLL